LSRIATLSEIENTWSILDVVEAHEALDFQAEVEKRASEYAAKQAKRRTRS
jgi:hypothetical protein